MDKLLQLLAANRGQIVSTASLSVALIDLAKKEDRFFADRDGLGFVWIPDEVRQDTPATPARRPGGYRVEDLDNLFSCYPPKNDQAERYGKISQAAKDFARVVLENTPACADQTVAVRKIMDARMSANMTIALNE